VVVDNFYVHGALWRPNKANAKLVIDPYAVLAGAIASQRFASGDTSWAAAAPAGGRNSRRLSCLTTDCTLIPRQSSS